jgi:hypothetical protein
MTIGVVATLGNSKGISTACLLACCRSATWSAQVEEAGTHTSGRAPWVDSSQPVDRAAAASAESVPRTWTSTQRSSTAGRRRSYSAAAWVITPAWSGEATTCSGRLPPRQARLWAGWLKKSTNPPIPRARTSRTQAAASSAVGRRRRRWARCLPPTDACSCSIVVPAASAGRRARGSYAPRGAGPTWLHVPQRLPCSMLVCKIRPGSGGFVAFLRTSLGRIATFVA